MSPYLARRIRTEQEARDAVLERRLLWQLAAINACIGRMNKLVDRSAAAIREAQEDRQ